MLGIKTIRSNWESFWFGLVLPYQSLRLILRTPKLIFWSIIPIIITFFLYGLIVSQIQNTASTLLNHWLLTLGVSPQGWIGVAALWIVRALAFIFSILTFSFVAAAVACPFNDFLAEASERCANPPLPAVPNQSWILKGRLLVLDLFKTLIAVCMNVIALFVSWIPILNFLALITTFLTMSFQFLSYPQTRRKQGIQDGVLFIMNNFYSCLGFGASLSFLFTIPIVSTFALPIAVVGGTLLFAEAQEPS